jgi:signal transduction histidine kinase
MLESIVSFFSGDGFMPHGHCYLWNPGLIWLHVVSDALIALSYISIPFTLLHFVRRRTDIPFNWMFLCFGAFIVACGATHAMEIWTLWTPSYWLAGTVKAITAAASVPTAVLLVRLVPRALAMPSPAELQKAHADLRAAHDELEAFSYSVAHDLRAPLRAINAFSQALRKEHSASLDADGLDCLSEITTNAERMAALIDALLALSRVARMDVNTQRVDLAELARASAARLSAENPSRKVDVVTPEHLPAQMDVDLANTMVDNLMGNAWKFTANVDEARIELGVRADRDSQVFFVRDNGAGFDPAYANKLFTPFQRLHPASVFPGNGVGLATVRRIVQRHGGSIRAEGAVGRGATFYFTLPA